MHIDDKIASEFCKSFITAAAFRAYLKPLLEAAAPATPSTPASNGPTSPHKDKAKELLNAIKDGEFAVDPWETKFVSDQCYVNIPSESQENRLNMLWNRYQDSNA